MNQPDKTHLPASRARISGAFAALGVLLFVTGGASPDDWYPFAQFAAGVACMAISHVLTPCQDQITRWWRYRVLRQRNGRDEPLPRE